MADIERLSALASDPDGELKRQRFVYEMFDRLDGLKRVPPRRKLGVPFYDMAPGFVVEGEITAPNGKYNFDTGQVAVPGPVNVTAADGYRMVTNGVGIDLKARKLAGAGGVSGELPSGVFSADRMSADLGERTVTLEGRARLRMTPGKFRMPQ